MIFSRSNNPFINGTPTETFYNLSVNKSGGKVQPIDNLTDITVSNNFVITSGTFETGGNTLAVTGNSTIGGTLSTNDATGIANLNTVAFSGGIIGSSTNTGTVNIGGTLIVSAGDGTNGRVKLNVAGTTSRAANRP